jgi:outer membrane immunogenic protein
MRKWVAGLAAAASLSFVAQAALADGPYGRRGLKDHGARCASFHGFYVGGNVGGGYYDWTLSDRDAWAKDIDDDISSHTASTDNGWVGGVQAGFNWQRGCTVFGFEADWSWTNLGNSKLQADGDAPPGDDSLRVTSDLNWFGTLRTRTGVVVDNLLLYATGGLAYADIDRVFTLTNPGVAAQTFSFNDTRWGWVAGVGTEWALSSNVSIKSEALYVRFDEETSTHTSLITPVGVAEPKRFDHQDSLWVARIGLNFRFGCGSVC